MRRFKAIAVVITALFFLTFDWFWESQGSLTYWNNGTVASIRTNCESSFKKAVLLCDHCTKLVKNENFANKSQIAPRAKLFGQLPLDPKYLLIGIPSVSRKKENYLHQTLQSLISNMNANEQSNVTILVMFADSDPHVRLKRAKETTLKFTESIRSGILLLAQIVPETYPQIDIVRRTYNDSENRIKWRSKQVLDFAFLLNYSQNLSEYFLILEDDVVSTPRFVTLIQRFIDEKKNYDWVSLTFSNFFIIGRLMKSVYLNKLSQFLVMFHLEKPVDLLLLQFLDILVPDMHIATRRIPGLFQHIGLFSSLDGKIQKAKDRSFAASNRIFHFANPPADIVTTLGIYRNHYPEFCYIDSNKFFWGSSPKRNDTFDIIFHYPVKVKRIFISSGLPTNRADAIKYALLKAAPMYKNMLSNKKAECEGFHMITAFEKGSVDVSYDSVFKPEVIQCLRIEFIKRNSNWVLINEISIDSDGPVND